MSGSAQGAARGIPLPELIRCHSASAGATVRRDVIAVGSTVGDEMKYVYDFVTDRAHDHAEVITKPQEGVEFPALCLVTAATRL
jgi:hypothetical protein